MGAPGGTPSRRQQYLGAHAVQRAFASRLSTNGMDGGKTEMVSRRSILRRKRYAEDPEYRERSCAAARRYRATHKERVNRRRQELRYGISTADYDALLARQGGACAICRRKSDRRLQVDHCHTTKEVRGLLCNNCNTTLGRCRDDPDILRAAIAYLEASRRESAEPISGRTSDASTHRTSDAATPPAAPPRRPAAGSARRRRHIR